MPAEKERPYVPAEKERPQVSPSVKCRLGGGTAEPVAAVVVDGEHRGRDEPGYRVNQQQVLK